MQFGVTIPHYYSALYVMASNPNVEEKLRRNFFNTIEGIPKFSNRPK